MPSQHPARRWCSCLKSCLLIFTARSTLETCNATDAFPLEGTSRPYDRGHSLPFGTIKGNAGVGSTFPPAAAAPHPGPAATNSRCDPGTHVASAYPTLSLLLVSLALLTVPHFGFQFPPPSLGSKFRHSFLALTVGTLSGTGPRLHIPTGGTPSSRPPSPTHGSQTS